MGVNKNGLDVWICLQGSVQNENLHQKMMEALGPWGLGVKTAHIVLLLLCFWYNVTSGIARCRNHDFGQPWLYLVDQIQLRIQELYNVQVYPNHANMLHFEHEVDHVAVGIGPLSYLPDYVTSGLPHPLLKGDIKFLAERMHFTLPPPPPNIKLNRKDNFQRTNKLEATAVEKEIANKASLEQ